MTPFWEDDHLTLYGGDCRTVLASMPAESVHCVVTSPPYWGLRDYGTATWDGGDPACDHRKASGGTRNGGRDRAASGGTFHDSPRIEPDLGMPYQDTCRKCGARRIDSQLGLEPTPEEYVANMVAVFREVRRVLRSDGTLWLNLGSSYCSTDGYPIKPTDAAWLAGLIDGEGCIQVHRQEKANGWAPSFQLDLSVGMMTSEAVQKAYEITGLGSCHQQNRGVWDWSVRGQQTATLLRAIYPFLVTKRRQAAYGVMLSDDLTERRGNRVRPLTEEAIEYRQAIRHAISELNQRREPELEMREPTPLALAIKAKDDLMIPARVALALQADGWYLRSEIVWGKPNPMPESVTDRPTKSHEMLYLLSKAPRYYFDADAVREALSPTASYGGTYGVDGRDSVHVIPGRTGEPIQAVHRAGKTIEPNPAGRNLRSVWNIATEPYPGAHFATFPRKLVEPCVKAGTSERGVCPECGAPWERVTEVVGHDRQRWAPGEDQYHTQAKGKHGATSAFTTGDVAVRSTTGWRPCCDHDAEPVPATVLDPFAGSGTTLLVAQSLGRRGVGIDLNPDYLKQALIRNAQTPLGLVG